jgi:hypothetical protein
MILKMWGGAEDSDRQSRGLFSFLGFRGPPSSLGCRTPTQALSPSSFKIGDIDLSAEQGVASTPTEHIPRARAIKSKGTALAPQALDCPSASECQVGRVEAKAELQLSKGVTTLKREATRWPGYVRILQQKTPAGISGTPP